MTSVAHLYEDFSTFAGLGHMTAETTEDELENAQLTGFESGYQAGWDDAVKAKDDESGKLTADLVQSVQDMSFTYQEAYAKLTTGMRPLMSRFVTSVLPKIAHDGLHFQLVEQIEKLMEAQLDNVVELVVSPRQRSVIEEVLSDKVGIPFSITEEPSLSDGQVYLRVNEHEREINIDAILMEVSEAMNAFFHATQSEVKHG